MITEDTTPYKEPFKVAVLKHIHESLSPDEWERLRSLALNRNNYSSRHDKADLEATPELLLNEALSEDNISVEETLLPIYKSVQIDEIAGQPVYYLEGEGVYLWGEQPDSIPTLTFWVAHPAYPPGW
jgi:hypothetical protein